MYLFKHLDGHTSLYSATQIIENARQQQAAGLAPMYRYNFGHGDYSSPGYLVASGPEGCIVCALLDNGNTHIMQGFQGDFVFG